MSNPVIAKLFEENEKLKARVSELESTAVCMYCNAILHTKEGQAKIDMVIEHMAVCEKHPVSGLLAKVEQLTADKRELVEAMELMINVFSVRNGEPGPDMHIEILVHDKAQALIAKHKEGEAKEYPQSPVGPCLAGSWPKECTQKGFKLCKNTETKK